MGTKLFVGNLSYNTTEGSLRALFEADGKQVSRITIVTDRETGRSRGFAFAEFGTDEEAAQAMAAFDGKELDGRQIRVSEANERAP